MSPAELRRARAAAPRLPIVASGGACSVSIPAAAPRPTRKG